MLYSPCNSDQRAGTNSVEPDQTAPLEQFDLDLLCLPMLQHVIDTSPGLKLKLLELKNGYNKKKGVYLTIWNKDDTFVSLLL